LLPLQTTCKTQCKGWFTPKSQSCYDEDLDDKESANEKAELSD
jgi:hypothetical protein